MVTVPRPRRHGAVRTAAAAALVFALALGAPAAAVLVSAPVAYALPPGGGNSVNSPGTSSEVAPSSLQAGESLSWSVGGMPPGVPVYVKLDDGSTCPSDAPQGSCVLASVLVGGDGRASGSIVLPSDLAAGTHSLRFLATGPAPERLGYSHRSADFQVVTAQAAAAGGIQVAEGGAALAVPGAATGGASGGQAASGPDVVVVDAQGQPVAAAPGAPARAAAGGAAEVASPGVASAPAGTAGGSAAGVRPASAARAGSVQAVAAGADGLTPYANIAPVASTVGAPLPWAGIVAVMVSGLVAVAMLTASVLVTRRPAGSG